MKYLGINTMKYVQDLYEKDYKTLMKNIKAELINEDIPYSLIGRLNIVKFPVLPNIICIFSVNPVKIPASYLGILKN